MRTAHSRSLALFSVAVVLVLSVPGLFAEEKTYSGIVVFGTSLSDPGNAFAFQREANTPPYDDLDPLLLVPYKSYAKGGHHFTNGATWVEQFARTLGLAGSTRPAFQAAGGKATNYAVGSARAYQGEVTLAALVNAFLQDVNGVAPSDALYVIEMGSNDVRDALPPTADREAILQGAIGSIVQAMQTLYAAGARHFLVWSVPDIGLTPALLRLDQAEPGTAAWATQLTQVFNTALALSLTSLQALPGIRITPLDVFTLIQELVAHAEDFELAVVDTACVTPNVPPFECRRPDEYLFWDGIHPTAAVHAIVAQRAMYALAQP